MLPNIGAKKDSARVKGKEIQGERTAIKVPKVIVIIQTNYEMSLQQALLLSLQPAHPRIMGRKTTMCRKQSSWRNDGAGMCERSKSESAKRRGDRTRRDVSFIEWRG